MKVAGRYHSLLRGVSEQSPELRQPGQVTEQVNLSSDPVKGLSRRFGTQYRGEAKVLDTGYDMADVQSDTDNWRTFDYFSQGVDYTLCVRRAASTSDLPVCVVYDRTNSAWLTVERPVTDADLDTLISGGVSAITNVGKYVFMAGNSLVPANTDTDAWGSDDNLEKALVWVRGGAYARRYAVTATKLDNTQISFEYTTPAASYPGVLDTKGVPVYLPDTTGSSTGSGPVLGTATETVGAFPGIGVTHNLTFAANSPQGVVVSGTTTTIRYQENHDDEVIIAVNFINGLDYTYASGVVTVLRPLNSALVTVTYQYVASGGSAGTIVYATETTTEAAFITNVSGYGAAVLGFKDWNPVTMEVRNGQQLLTNVTPAVPASPDEYSWAEGASAAVFNVGLVGSQTVTMKYTHTKTVLNPNYSKQVNDVTNEYNTQVTNWIGEAARAIQPNNIIIKLQAAAITAGLPSATVGGPNLIFDNVKSLSVDDGGDGTLIRGVADEIASVDEVSVTHSVGKVVKVRGKTSKESFYLRATAKDRTVTSGYTEVIWVEGAGTIHATDLKLIMGTAIAGVFYMASTAAALATLTSLTDVPDYVDSDVGDGDTNPLPFFVGRKITFLDVFQDRLVVGSGGVLRMSKVAEYLTFYRSTVLTLPADDAVEFLAKGAEDDVLRYSVLYDQNYILFGLKRQYIINGKQPLTPTNANMIPMSSHADAAELPPLAQGDFIFYGKKGPSSSSVHQIQPGENTSSPASYIISSQIDLYLKGAAIEMIGTAKPSTLFIRTTGSRSSLYLFNYFDQQDGRKQDAWHRWDYNPSAGLIVGMQPTSEGVLIFSMRDSAAGLYVVADLQVFTTGLSVLPYLDSSRLTVGLSGSMLTSTPELQCAFSNEDQYKFIGGDSADLTAMLAEFPGANPLHVWHGFGYDAYVTPTNPFQRDDNGAITSGRLTVGKLLVSYEDSSGYVKTQKNFGLDSPDDTENFNGRIFGDPNNIIGREPVTTYQKTVVIGRESRDYEVTLKSRKWFPFTIKTIEVIGQRFNRTQQLPM